LKKIEAMLEPSEVEGVRDRLSGVGVREVTVTEVHDFGASGGHILVHRGRKYELPYVVEAKLEVVVAEEGASTAVAILQGAAKMDDEGGARVLVFSLDNPVRLRATGSAAAV
jgi:nitrogen regulatory protein PII